MENSISSGGREETNRIWAVSQAESFTDSSHTTHSPRQCVHVINPCVRLICQALGQIWNWKEAGIKNLFQSHSLPISLMEQNRKLYKSWKPRKVEFCIPSVSTFFTSVTSPITMFFINYEFQDSYPQVSNLSSHSGITINSRSCWWHHTLFHMLFWCQLHPTSIRD